MSDNEIKPVDLLALSDEDFLKKNPPDQADDQGAATNGGNESQSETSDTSASGTDAGAVGAVAGAEPAKVESAATVQGVQSSDGQQSDAGAGGAGGADSKAAGAAEDGSNEEAVGNVDPAAQKAGEKSDVGTEGSESEKKPLSVGSKEGEATSTLTPPSNEDAQSFFMQIMAPFKANGKTIQLKDAKEAIQLMQMGANYTRKLQELQPHRKMLMMLQNNDLMDEDRLSFLIDLDRKNPEAIKKLIKDAGLDPLEIDTSTDSDYRPGSHAVTDQEANFQSTLQDLGSSEGGKETLVEINSKWDQASKEVVWKSPEIMTVIHTQREAGIYGKIVDEMDRRITLGQIPAGTPFLQAYKTVGDEMAEAVLKAAGQSGGQSTEVASGDPTKTPAVAGAAKVEAQPLAVRAAVPKSTVANGAQADAASPTRSTPGTKKPFVNPLAMSDDEFLKSMSGRV